MDESLKDLTLKYLESLPEDIQFDTSLKSWTREDLIREVENDTELGKHIIERNRRHLLK